MDTSEARATCNWCSRLLLSGTYGLESTLAHGSPIARSKLSGTNKPDWHECGLHAPQQLLQAAAKEDSAMSYSKCASALATAQVLRASPLPCHLAPRCHEHRIEGHVPDLALAEHVHS